MKTGRNPNMSHMSRTHRINIGFMHEVVSRGQISLCHCRTSDMCADVFTKHFTNKVTWQNCVDNIAHVNPKRMWKSKSSRGEKKALASNPSTTQKHNRTLVEFCCGPNSVLGQPSDAPEGCNVIRLTADDDVTTPRGREKAMKAVESKCCLLWASMPCTGGCPWQHINIKFPGMRAKLRKYYAEFRAIWKCFVEVARKVIERGGHVAVEWPASCAYWSWDCVKEFASEVGLKFVRFDGCALGVVSLKTGLPIRKPWKVATTSDFIVNAFSGRLCTGDHEHTTCRGADAKNSENYSPLFADLVHGALREHSNGRVRHALCCVRVLPRASLPLSLSLSL